MTAQELADGYAALYNDASFVMKATIAARSVDEFNNGAAAADIPVRAERIDGEVQCVVDAGLTMVFDVERSVTLFSREGCSTDFQSADVVVQGFWNASEALEGESIFELMRPQIAPAS